MTAGGFRFIVGSVPDQYRSCRVTIENGNQLDLLRRVGSVVAATCRLMGSRLEPGMTTRELDGIGRAALEKEGCRPAPELMYGFPGATCISINHAVAHGIPDDTPIRAGDMVNIDVSAECDGVFADTGAQFAEETDDGWTLATEPDILTAQYEHTLVVTRRGPIVVTV
jgi:methionine aminopeptidase